MDRADMQRQERRFVRIGGGLAVKVNAYSLEIFQNGKRVQGVGEIEIDADMTAEHRALSTAAGTDPWDGTLKE